MSYRIRLLPSDHSFVAEQREALLDAALRAGVAVEYGCSTGSCGDCKARLLDGQLADCKHHDFRLSELERQQGWFLPCRCSAASDLIVEAVEAGGVEDIPEQEIQAKINKIERRGEDFVVLHLRTPRSQTLRFMAGQRVELVLENGLSHRSPVASCPCNGMLLQFHVFHVQGDPFAEYVFNQLRSGEKIAVVGPKGRFTLDDDSARPLVFITFETGFAATKSLLEHAISLDEDRFMHLFWLARTNHCHYMENLCRSWADSLDDFHYSPLLSPEDGFRRYLQEIAAGLVDAGSVDIYVTGPVELSLLALDVLPAFGVDPKRIFTDLPGAELL